MTNILSVLLDPDDDNATDADPAALLAQAEQQLSELQGIFAARGDGLYLARVRELRQVLKRLRQSTRTPTQ